MSAPTARGIATLRGAEAAEAVKAYHLEDYPRRVARTGHRAAAGTAPKEPVVVAVAVDDPNEAAELADLLLVLREQLADDRTAREEVLRTLLPAERLTLSPALLEQVQRNAAAQAELADEFGLLSSTEVAALAGSGASNRAATASRLRSRRRAFAVDLDGVQRFPGFQFAENGKPLPVIAQVLELLGDRLTGWEMALWFTSSSDWLGGELRPVDVLESDPEMVVQAAALADQLPDRAQA